MSLVEGGCSLSVYGLFGGYKQSGNARESGARPVLRNTFPRSTRRRSPRCKEGGDCPSKNYDRCTPTLPSTTTSSGASDRCEFLSLIEVGCSLFIFVSMFQVAAGATPPPATNFYARRPLRLCSETGPYMKYRLREEESEKTAPVLEEGAWSGLYWRTTETRRSHKKGWRKGRRVCRFHTGLHPREV